MSSPFPSELTVSKRGDRVAWAFAAEGKRDIWVAESPGFAARQLTRSYNDDGGALSELVFAPTGNLLAYVRGEGRNQPASIRTRARIQREHLNRFGSSTFAPVVQLSSAKETRRPSTRQAVTSSGSATASF